MPTSGPFESVLIAARHGAEWAWERLVGDLDGSLRGYVRRQGGVDVDDLLGETWLQVARGLTRFSGDEAAFRSWVFMIAHHRIVDERRRIRRKRVDSVEAIVLDEAATEVRSAESEAIERMADEELLRMLDMLPQDQREVIVLRFVACFGVTEIARIVGKSPGAVRALQRRALRRLEKILGEGGTFSP
ncbi:MAG: sigma-70 family RNA polymerase sigma factor [Clostridiales bacterium]|nr:sigma-70 family RNA polymerase sigma factor [Clostridiales bacterium]